MCENDLRFYLEKYGKGKDHGSSQRTYRVEDPEGLIELVM